MICCAVVSIPGSGPRNASRQVGRVVWNIHPNSIAGMGKTIMDNSLATSRDRLGRVWNRNGFEDDQESQCRSRRRRNTSGPGDKENVGREEVDRGDEPFGRLIIVSG